MATDECGAIPVLVGEAAQAVAYRGGHVQIIAAAGSGKTEVVSQRVAALLVDGEDPAAIVAFTFTEKAAKELKERIRQRVTARLGESASDRLGQLFVGTIHSYCFRLLQTHVPKYETYTPLDENQLINLLYRENRRLNLRRFDRQEKLFRGLGVFQRNVDVVENELIAIRQLDAGDFRDALVRYYAMLDDYRCMSFGTQIVRAVEALRSPTVHAGVASNLRHLVVDEYQDVNPAQEELIKLLAKPAGNAELTVVGDDDQAIYQWRGSDVANIVSFAQRYPGARQFHLMANRRSRPGVISLANTFAKSIPGRLSKQMDPHRPSYGPAVGFSMNAYDEQAEADAVAQSVQRLHRLGVPYRAIAILVRGKVAYPKILDALAAANVPVQPGGRSGLFEQPDASLFGGTYAWLAGTDWASARYQARCRISIDDLLREYALQFGLDRRETDALRRHLQEWQARTLDTDRNVNLVGDFYALLALLKVAQWDSTDADARNRLGTIARFTQVLADYETVTRRSRSDGAGRQVGGQPGSAWFYRNLAILLVNSALGGYDDFEGESDLSLDAVALGTVHGAKGLEWPVVFLPSLTARRFPSCRAGERQEWLVPRGLFDADRYEGGDADERRLFYVALTRARDWVSLSNHERVTTARCAPSPYLLEARAAVRANGFVKSAEAAPADASDLAVTYSELAAYSDCPQGFLLRHELGFQPPLQREIGYGNAVHHVMRQVAEHTKAAGQPPTARQIDAMLAADFFLPFANSRAHEEMRDKARRLVLAYVRLHHADLRRTWATERPFELYLPGVVLSGRADVIYDEVGGVPANLAIVDYKTATHQQFEPLQLQVYADAGRREGLTVAAAFIHDLSNGQRHEVSVDPTSIAAAESQVSATADALRRRDFTPRPRPQRCRHCDVKAVCSESRAA